jgi:hypothetical protein
MKTHARTVKQRHGFVCLCVCVFVLLRHSCKTGAEIIHFLCCRIIYKNKEKRRGEKGKKKNNARSCSNLLEFARIFSNLFEFDFFEFGEKGEINAQYPPLPHGPCSNSSRLQSGMQSFSCL